MSNLSTTTREPGREPEYVTFATALPHPGEHLREDYLPDYGLSALELADAMGLADPQELEAVLREEQPLTAELALRLARVFATSARMWMQFQAGHDLSKAAIASREELARIQPIAAAAA